MNTTLETPLLVISSDFIQSQLQAVLCLLRCKKPNKTGFVNNLLTCFIVYEYSMSCI